MALSTAHSVADARASSAVGPFYGNKLLHSKLKAVTLEKTQILHCDDKKEQKPKKMLIYSNGKVVLGYAHLRSVHVFCYRPRWPVKLKDLLIISPDANWTSTPRGYVKDLRCFFKHYQSIQQ